MSHRFFVSFAITGSSVVLEGPEAHHLGRVMRTKVGETVTLFDGHGAEFTARVTQLDRDAVELDILTCVEVDREQTSRLTLGVALPKGERQRWLIEKTVELGVAQVIPLLTERGVAQPGEQSLNRLRRVVIESSKQCGRNRLMEIGPPQHLADFLLTAPIESRRCIADSTDSEDPLPNDVALKSGKMVKDIYVAIGPEGGFSRKELHSAKHAGWQTIHLGPCTLRVETAALSVAAFVALASR